MSTPKSMCLNSQPLVPHVSLSAGCHHLSLPLLKLLTLKIISGELGSLYSHAYRCVAVSDVVSVSYVIKSSTRCSMTQLRCQSCIQQALLGV